MTSLRMGNPAELTSLQIKLLQFLAGGPQSMKQICRQLRIVSEQAEKMIKPLIDNRFITKQGNSQYRNFIKPADIPAMPVMKADPEPAAAAEDKPVVNVGDEPASEGEASSCLIKRGTTFDFAALESSVVDASSIISHSRAVEIGSVIAKARANTVLTIPSKSVENWAGHAMVLPVDYPKHQYKMGNIEVSNIEIDPLLRAHASLVEQVEKNYILPEELIGGDKQTTGLIEAARYRNDLDQLARIYHEKWFKSADLVGLHCGEVVFESESVWPNHLYFGVTPLFTEEDLIAKRVELGLQQVPCASCQQPMTPEDIRHLGHVCSECENLTYVDTDSTPHCAPDDLPAALAELSELKAKYARCEALGQLVAGANVKLQYLTGLRLFVKETAPKGLFLLDEILADYHQLAGFGGDK